MLEYYVIKNREYWTDCWTLLSIWWKFFTAVKLVSSLEQ